MPALLCPECRERPLQGRADTCSGRCRQRRSRRVHRERQAKAGALVQKQSAALASGDDAAVRALQREISRLLGV